MANAEIVAIGSELLLGQIVDTNSAWMAERLTQIGVDLYFKTIVGDNPGRMREVIHRALERSDVVITSGGLGPTKDDITREIIAEVTERSLIIDSDLTRQIEDRFRSRGLVMTKNNERQALIPEGAIVVPNPNGTAPSFIVENSQGSIFCLPGVPFELKWLFDHEVVPYLRQKLRLSEIITYRVLKVAGMGESNVDDLIGHLIEQSENPTVGILAHPGQVDVRITAKAPSIEIAEQLIAPIEQKVKQLLEGHIFGVDKQSMEDVVGALLMTENITVASYEDITGGLLADRLIKADPTRFIEGTVGGGIKSILRLLEKLPKSAECLPELKYPEVLVNDLANAVRINSGSDYGIALHGVPDKEENVQNLAKGQTYICVTDGETTNTRTYNISGRGTPDRTRLSLNAIELLRSTLMA